MPYHLSVTLPIDELQYGSEFVGQQAITELAQTAEKAGFWAGTCTDHPIPSYRWLDNGGHYAQDPFVILSMVAAVTSRLRLQSNIVVLPLRNPFITARAVSSLDVFSEGRVVFGVGAGYLKPEFKALGVPFDDRNDLMDEYLVAMKLAWKGEDFAFEGTGYTAVGNRMLPTPVQKPHPPLLIGGNSKRALRRTAEHGDAWHPFIVPKMVTDTARTANISSDDDIRDAIAYMHEHCAKIGRATPPDVILSSTFSIKQGFNAQEAIDGYEHMRSLGSIGSGASINVPTRAEWCDLALQFGEEVIAKLD